jgi:hypothetical protein
MTWAAVNPISICHYGMYGSSAGTTGCDMKNGYASLSIARSQHHRRVSLSVWMGFIDASSASS